MRFPKQHAATDDLSSQGAGGGNGAGQQGQQQSGQAQQQGQQQSQSVTWPEQWRQTIAGQDQNELKRLERFSAPTELYKSYRALENRMASGELKAVTPFPEKGTPEQQAAWRNENGIPESHDKYDLGLTLEEADKPIVDSFLKSAHAANLSPAAAKASVQWFMDHQAEVEEQRSLQDKEIAQKGVDDLRNEWGADYRLNLNVINSLLDQAPEGIKEAFLGGRMNDGTPIGSHPGMLKFLSNLSRQINPVATLIPGSGNNPNAIADEIASIEKTMRENRAAYNADEKMQQRYRDLITAREQLNKK